MRLATLLFAALLAAAAHAQSSSSDTCTTGITVAGTGTVDAEPDLGVVNLAVQVTRPSSNAARVQAANITNDVTKAISAIPGINGTQDVTTANIMVQEQYAYGPNGERSEQPTGYQFTQQLTIKIRNVTSDLVGQVVDEAVKAGGNNVTIASVSMDLSPEYKQQVMAQAQEQAVANAQASAAVLAKASGVTLGPLVSISSASSVPVPIPYAGMDTAAAAPQSAKVSTPINIGLIEVTASVTANYAISTPSQG